MSHNVYLYILVMAIVTYLIRMLPLALAKNEIRSPFIKSFLYYVPYACLAAMTFPAILKATAAAGTSLVQGIFGVFFSSCFLSFRSFSMLPYSLLFSCGLCQTLLFRNQQTSAADIALCLRQRLPDICDHIRFNSEII